MASLEKNLHRWASVNLISDGQAKKILHYEHSRPSSSWAIYGFFLLGAVVISIGAVSFIAANWKEIPDGVKLAFDFLLLFLLGGGVYLSWDKKRPMAFEVLIVSFMLFSLASIGLISQIYHTGGKLYQALLLWSVITSGVAAASRRSSAPSIWGVGFLGGAAFWAIDAPWPQSIFQGNVAAVCMAIPLLSALLAMACHLIARAAPQERALTWLTLIGVLIGQAMAESLPFLQNPEREILPLATGYILCALLVLGIWKGLDYKKSQKALLTVALGLYLVPFHFPLLFIDSKVVYAANSIALLAVLAVFFAGLKARRIFQLLLVILGIRFLTLYFQALGGLATTGAGLMASGAMIVVAVFLWSKYRQGLTLWAEGLLK